MSDDHTSQAWGIYGGVLEQYAVNQNIKRLAEEGVVLDNAFCTNSICVPSRASILTGQYSHNNQVYTLTDVLHPHQQNVAQLIQKTGYQTALIGKWHLKDKPSGFDHFNILPGQGRYHNPILKNNDNWEYGNKGGNEYKGFSSDVIMDESLKWLDQRDKEKPFMLMTHFKATHEPFDYPERFKNLFENDTIPEPVSLLDFDPNSRDVALMAKSLKSWQSDGGKPLSKTMAVTPGFLSIQMVWMLFRQKKNLSKICQRLFEIGRSHR